MPNKARKHAKNGKYLDLPRELREVYKEKYQKECQENRGQNIKGQEYRLKNSDFIWYRGRRQFKDLEQERDIQEGYALRQFTQQQCVRWINRKN